MRTSSERMVSTFVPTFCRTCGGYTRQRNFIMNNHSPAKRFYFLFLTVLCLLGLLAGCGTEENNPDQSTTDTTSMTAQSQQTQPTEEPEPVIINGTYILEPSIYAESIEYYQTTVPCPFAVIQNEDGSGLIDYTGKLLLAPGEYYIDPSQTGVGSTEVRLLARALDGSEYWVQTDGSLRRAYLTGWGGSNGAQVWWDSAQNEPVLFVYSGGGWESYFSYRTFSSYMEPSWNLGVLIDETPKVLAVKSITGYHQESDGRFTVEGEGAYYGLLDMTTGEMMTDFIYEKTGTYGAVNGIIALKKDGKWGYMNEDGVMITDFIYDASETSVVGYEECYSPLNGYLIVRQGEKWGLLDTDGNIVLSPIFDGLSQVNEDGQLWVREDDQWGVMQLNDANNVSES